MTKFFEQDRQWMERALTLARKGEGLTRPNPPVGAVIVKNGKIVGEGWHKKAGGPHAEVFALKQAGAAARNATLYVTLEPCSTHGRTPPCCKALLAAGISRVVAAVRDPNPRHCGRGFKLLKKHGVQVEAGLCQAEGVDLLRPFTIYTIRRRPMITLKLGLSLDGRIADYQYASKWITGQPARHKVQILRRQSDAIMVGAETVRRDNPSLWPRPSAVNNPWRIILVNRGTLPKLAPVFTDEHADRTIVAAPAGWQPKLAAQLTAQGVTVLSLPADNFLNALMQDLWKRGILHIFCEGGGQLAGFLLAAGVVDEAYLFFAPRFLGGPVGACGAAQWPLPEAPEFKLKQLEQIGPDIMARLLAVREEKA